MNVKSDPPMAPTARVEHRVNRRQFLQTALTTVSAALIPASGFAAIPRSKTIASREIALVNMNTNENLEIRYFERGQYQAKSLRQINHLLRDHRTNEIMWIDPHLIDILHGVWLKTKKRQPLKIISGYRSPATNRMLRRRSRRVARNSFHTKGMAVDFRLSGYSTWNLRQAAAKLRMGGVGYYPRSGFVHVDTGDIRFWRG